MGEGAKKTIKKKNIEIGGVIIREELISLYNEYNDTLNLLNFADNDFIDVVIYKLIALEKQIEVVLKRIKNEEICL